MKILCNLPFPFLSLLTSSLTFLPRRVAIITGPGSKAFCAGMDLKGTNPPKDPNSQRKSHTSTEQASLTTPTIPSYPPSGFAGLTLRHGKKPIIAAVNGRKHNPLP
jgi:enoyl-CoA hydratase/carnithine racemase